MKIIGKTGSGYIAEVTEEEVAKIAGFSSTYARDYRPHLKSIGAADHEGRLQIGAVIPVSNFWNRLSAIREHSTELAKLGATMRGLADLVDGAWPAAQVEVQKLTGDSAP